MTPPGGLARLPIFLLFLVQAGIGVLTILQPILGNAMPGVYRDWVPSLEGMRIRPDPVELSLSSALDGRFQRAAQEWVADHVVQRAVMVRAYNEVLWQSFHASYMANRSLVLGPRGTLFEKSYILAHCGTQLATVVPALPEFAHRLRAAQDWFTRRGRRLVYYSAMVKTTWFQDRFPPRFPCPEDQRDQVRPFVIAAFQKAGVDYIDGRTTLEQQRGQLPVELFPRNGIHWNELGAAIGTNALVQKLRELGVSGIAPLNYQFSVARDEAGQDRDLSILLNLLWQPPGGPAPVLAITPSEPPGTLRLAAINDSFFYMPMHLMEAAHIIRSGTELEYMTLLQRRFENGGVTSITADAAEIRRIVLEADIVVLEEVESRVGGPFALQLLDLVETEAAQEQAGSPP